MDQAVRHGQTEHGMQVVGNLDPLLVKEHSITPMATYLRGTSKMIRQTEKVPILM